MRNLPQQVSLAAEVAQMGYGLIDERARLQFGTLDSKHGQEGCLALTGILAECLARNLLTALDIENIVGDLEGEADVTRITAQRCPAFGGSRPMIAPASMQNPISAPVFNCWSRVTVCRS